MKYIVTLDWHLAVESGDRSVSAVSAAVVIR